MTTESTPAETERRIPPDELRGLFLFEHLDDDQLRWVCEHSDVIDVAAGHELCTEGDPAECFFVLLRGALVMSRQVGAEQVERGLVQDGRLIRLRIHLLDKPGALLELTEIIARHRVNIVDTLYNRAYYGVNLGDTTIDITMETRGREQLEELLAAMTAAGYRFSRVI